MQPARPIRSTAKAGHAIRNLGFFNPGSVLAAFGLLAFLLTPVYCIFSVPRLLVPTTLMMGCGAGLTLIVIGMVIERLLVRWLCSECGNKVERHSTLCPTCRCLLVKRGSFLSSLTWAMLSAGVIFGLYLLITRNTGL